ncbi:hypothetical protein Tco_0123834 [Tanacetum coccineum]
MLLQRPHVKVRNFHFIRECPYTLVRKLITRSALVTIEVALFHGTWKWTSRYDRGKLMSIDPEMEEVIELWPMIRWTKNSSLFLKGQAEQKRKIEFILQRPLAEPIKGARQGGNCLPKVEECETLFRPSFAELMIGLSKYHAVIAVPTKDRLFQCLFEIDLSVGVIITPEYYVNKIYSNEAFRTQEIKRLKRSRIPLVKVRWNSRRGPEFTWEREDSFKKKYPHLFTNRASSSTATP